MRYCVLDDDTQIGFHLDLAGTVLEQGNPEPRNRWAWHGADSTTSIRSTASRSGGAPK